MAIEMNKVKFTTKCCGNEMSIIMAHVAGDVREVARVLIPCDNQVNDNVKLSEEITASIKKRYRNSV